MSYLREIRRALAEEAADLFLLKLGSHSVSSRGLPSFPVSGPDAVVVWEKMVAVSAWYVEQVMVAQVGRGELHRVVVDTVVRDPGFVFPDSWVAGVESTVGELCAGLPADLADRQVGMVLRECGEALWESLSREFTMLVSR